MNKEEDFPEIIVTRRAGSRSIRMRFDQKGVLKVSAPKFLPKREVERTIFDNEDWIYKHFQAWKEENQKRKLLPGKEVEVLGRKVSWHIGDRARVFETTEGIEFYFPEEVYNQSNLPEKSFEKFLKACAQEYFGSTCSKLANQLGFRYKSLSIGSAKTKWGSCTFDNRLRFSCYAVLLPDDLKEHLIIHELVHTVHKNHGKLFYKSLCEISPDAMKKEAKLRKGKIPVF